MGQTRPEGYGERQRIIAGATKKRRAKLPGQSVTNGMIKVAVVRVQQPLTELDAIWFFSSFPLVECSRFKHRYDAHPYDRVSPTSAALFVPHAR